MAEPLLKDKSLDQWVAEVQGLSAVGDSRQVRSIVAVVAKCTLELTDRLAEASGEVRCLTDSTAAFNTEAGKLTEQLVRLNRSLTWATWVVAGGTLLVASATLLLALRAG